jgi:hypothetical protein
MKARAHETALRSREDLGAAVELDLCIRTAHRG